MGRRDRDLKQVTYRPPRKARAARAAGWVIVVLGPALVGVTNHWYGRFAALAVGVLCVAGLWASQVVYTTKDRDAYVWWLAEELPDGDPLTNSSVATIYSKYPPAVLDEIVTMIYQHDGNIHAAMHDPRLSEKGRDALTRAVASATPPTEPGPPPDENTDDPDDGDDGEDGLDDWEPVRT